MRNGNESEEEEANISPAKGLQRIDARIFSVLKIELITIPIPLSAPPSHRFCLRHL